MEKENYFDKIKIVIFFVLTILFAVLLCLLEYYNQIRVIHFDLGGFEKTELSEKTKIIDISETDNYFKVKGQIIAEIDSYKIDLALEDDVGNIGMYKTQYDKANNQFYTVIPKKYIEDEKTIYIVYMCNNENILIKTDVTLGGTIDE